MFISLDPISAMHLGLSNDPLVMRRAELMAQYILRQVPNHLLDDQREENRASLDLAAHRHIRDHLQRLQSELSSDPLENSLPYQRGSDSDQFDDGSHTMAFAPTAVVRPAGNTADSVHYTTESDRHRNSAVAIHSRKNQILPDVSRGLMGSTSADRVAESRRLRDAARKVVHPEGVDAHRSRDRDGFETHILENTPSIN